MGRHARNQLPETPWRGTRRTIAGENLKQPDPASELGSLTEVVPMNIALKSGDQARRVYDGSHFRGQ